MSNLENALKIMLKAHAGQLDKAGQPYILHPIRVMLRLQKAEERIVALLHDVVEDSEITLLDLRNEGFSEEILTAIDCLTKREYEIYDEFISRISLNRLAVKVKIANITDNLDLSRLENLSEEDLKRIKKYHKALHSLKANSLLIAET